MYGAAFATVLFWIVDVAAGGLDMTKITVLAIQD